SCCPARRRGLLYPLSARIILMAELVLGLDLGTTNCKALAFAPNGELAASASIPTPVLARSRESSSPEYDANVLWESSARLMRRVVEQLPADRRIAGVAVTSMGESGVLLDSAGEPLVPVLTWHDRRTLAWKDWWRARLSGADLYRITGLPPDHISS